MVGSKIDLRHANFPSTMGSDQPYSERGKVIPLLRIAVPSSLYSRFHFLISSQTFVSKIFILNNILGSAHIESL